MPGGPHAPSVWLLLGWLWQRGWAHGTWLGAWTSIQSGPGLTASTPSRSWSWRASGRGAARQPQTRSPLPPPAAAWEQHRLRKHGTSRGPSRRTRRRRCACRAPRNWNSSRRRGTPAAPVPAWARAPRAWRVQPTCLYIRRHTHTAFTLFVHFCKYDVFHNKYNT